MESVDTLVIDKTGTLTEGKPKVVTVIAADGFDESELLRLAAGVEQGSEHPLAQAILNAASERKFALAAGSGFASPSGKGATGTVDGRKVALGNAMLMGELNVTTASIDAAAEAARQDGATAIYVAVDGRAAGVIAIADPIKPSAKAALQALRGEGLRIVMLTGDNLHHRARGGQSSASTRSRPACCRSARARWCSGCAAKAAASPWPATASTTRRRSPPPMSASPWAAAPMWRSKAPA